MRMLGSSIDLLAPSEMQLIHESSAQLLESPGIYIDHDGFLDALEAKGAKIDRAARTARIPAAVTTQAAKSVSDKPGLIRSDWHEVEQSLAADAAEALKQPYQFAFGGSALEMQADDGIGTRPATYQDLSDVIRFSNGHPRISRAGGPPVQCIYDEQGNEIPPALRPIAGMTHAAKHSKKLGWNEINVPADVEYAVRLGELLAGNAEYKNDPFFLCVKCSISPLKIAKESAHILYDLCQRSLPLGVAPMTLAGGTSPVTPASAILIANTEILGMLVALWAVGAESKQEHLVLGAIMDMQTTIASFSSPNAVMQDIGVGQMISRYYGLPFQVSTDYIDAKFPGYQSGSERAFKIAAAAASGQVLPSVGQLKSGLVCSCEQACLDIEAFDWWWHFMQGIEVSSDSLCLEMIQEKGIGGHFLDTEHTALNFRKEFFFPKLSDRHAETSTDMVEAAREQVRQILAETPEYSREEGLCREIDALYEREVSRRAK